MELPEDVQDFIERSFPPGQWREALLILGQAQTEDGIVPNSRLLRCAAFANYGKLEQLRQLASLLAVDWRDVIMAAEYELYDKVPVRIRNLNQQLL